MESKVEENNDQMENQDFDVSAFMNDDTDFGIDPKQRKEQTVDDSSNDDQENANVDSENNNNDDEDVSIWDMDLEDNSDSNDDNQESNNSEQSDDEDLNSDDNQELDQDDNSSNQSTNSEVLEQFKEIGIEAKNLDELKQKVQDVLQERDMYEKAKYNNKNIDSWKKALNLEDRELVLRNFLADKSITKEKAEEYTKNLEDNNMLSNKAHDIRVALRASISREQNFLIKAEEQKVAKQRENSERARKELEDQMQKIETMFGFAMGKKEDLPTKRKEHLDYMQSGKFFEEVTKDASSMIETAWFVRHKKQIIKALANKGIQTGKKEFLDDISNATTDESFRLDTSSDGKEFNPKAFMSEE